jgi:FkbM family methyltransferase
MDKRVKRLLRLLLPQTIHHHRILSGPLRRQCIVTSWHDYPAAILGYTERPLLDWFAQNVKPGETWLDIGAHYGYTAIALSRLVGPSGRVFAFEPMISTAGYVTQTRQLNNLPQLTVLPLGLAAPETLEMKQLPVTRGMVDSTIGQMTNDERRTTNDERKGWLETIMVARFDWLWPRICGGNLQIDGVKIDVQGMEIEVLCGMAETLREQRPRLVVEVHAGVSRAELLDLVESAGYARQATPIEPVVGEVEARFVDDHSYTFQNKPMRSL